MWISQICIHALSASWTQWWIKIIKYYQEARRGALRGVKADPLILFLDIVQGVTHSLQGSTPPHPRQIQPCPWTACMFVILCYIIAYLNCIISTVCAPGISTKYISLTSICLDQFLVVIRLLTTPCDHGWLKTRLIAIMNLTAKLGIIYIQRRWTIWVSVVTAATCCTVLTTIYRYCMGRGVRWAVGATACCGFMLCVVCAPLTVSRNVGRHLLDRHALTAAHCLTNSHPMTMPRACWCQRTLNAVTQIK